MKIFQQAAQILLLTGWGIAGSLWANALEAVPENVGELGDAQRLTFEGLRTFTPDAIRDGLMANAEFMLASHPRAPFADYLKAVQRKVLAGFQDSGFPDAKVTAVFDPASSQIRVTVLEGPRYAIGDVKVIGARTIPVRALVRRLTEPNLPDAVDSTEVRARALPRPALERFAPSLRAAGQPASKAVTRTSYLDASGKNVKVEPPIWEKKADSFACFDAASVRLLTTQVTNVLSEFGYFFAKAKVSIVPRVGWGTADLLVEIAEEGPHGAIGSIEIYGNNKSSREDILRCLKLKAGMPVERGLIANIERQLWRTGRFMRYKVQPEFVPGEKARIKLVLELTESEDAPPLSEDFSAEEKAMLKMREWLLDSLAKGQELVVEANWKRGPLPTFLPGLGGFEWIFCSRGWSWRTRPLGDAAQPGYAMVETTQAMALHSLDHQRKLALTGNRWALTASMAMAPESDAALENRCHLTFTGGVVAADPDSPPAPFRLDLMLAPVAFVSLAHGENSTNLWEKNILLIKGLESELRLDASSGRFIEWRYLSPEQECRISFQSGGFERAVKEIETATSAQPNSFDEEKPFSSLAGFVVEELLRAKTQAGVEPMAAETAQAVQRAGAVINKILAQGVFASFDSVLAKGPSSKDARFSVPSDVPSGSETSMKALISILAARIFKINNDLFPARSWPWTLAREAVFVAGGQGEYTSLELQRIYDSPQTGPLGYLTTASLLNFIKSPVAQNFAAKGLQRLSAEDFRQDCRLALEGTSGLAQSCERLVAALGSLDENDLAALAALVPKEDASLLLQSLRAFAGGKATPSLEAFSPVLDRLWEKHWRQETLKALVSAGNKALEIARTEAPFQEALKLYQVQGESRDDAEAVKLFRKAASQGHPGGEYYLGCCYENGRGVAKDFSEALKWYHRSAEHGQVDAQFTLANLYSEGLRLPQNHLEAFVWYSLAAAQGHQVAEAFRDGARRKLDSEQFAEANKRIKSLQSGKPAAPTSTPGRG